MNLKFYCGLLVLVFCVTFDSYAGESSHVEKVITNFLGEISSCTVEVSVKQLIKVSDGEGDYSAMRPEILSSDLQALVGVNLCDMKDQYYFWLREDGDSYRVISYTSFSQPE